MVAALLIGGALVGTTLSGAGATEDERKRVVLSGVPAEQCTDIQAAMANGAGATAIACGWNADGTPGGDLAGVKIFYYKLPPEE